MVASLLLVLTRTLSAVVGDSLGQTRVFTFFLAVIVSIGMTIQARAKSPEVAANGIRFGRIAAWIFFAMSLRLLLDFWIHAAIR